MKLYAPRLPLGSNVFLGASSRLADVSRIRSLSDVRVPRGGGYTVISETVPCGALILALTGQKN